MIYCHKKWFLAVFCAKKWFTGAKNHFLPLQKWFFTQENDFEGTQKWFSWNDFWNILCRFWRCDLLLVKKPFPSEMRISGNEWKSFFSRKCSTTSKFSTKRLWASIFAQNSEISTLFGSNLVLRHNNTYDWNVLLATYFLACSVKAGFGSCAFWIFWRLRVLKKW